MDSSSPNIRSYNFVDKEQILELLRLNTPNYFAIEEEKDLLCYLNSEVELYYVVELDNKIVGCGGINFENNKSIGKISWDIIHPDYQGKSIGSTLLKHRIDILLSMNNIQQIIVRTSQIAYKFYEKKGFELLEVTKNYWAEGFDLYFMKYKKLN